MKTIHLLIVLSLTQVLLSQEPIQVAENSFKVSGMGEQSFFHGFAYRVKSERVAYLKN